MLRNVASQVGEEEGALSVLQARIDSLEEELRDLRDTARPGVTVVVVNWNGQHLLQPCLESLLGQTYPHNSFRVVLVDNGSTDQSVGMVRREFPAVTILQAAENLGFAAGNNLAISASDSQYIALLNNDAVAHPNWLAELVSRAEDDPTVAAVTSKVWLTEDRLPISLAVSDVFIPGGADNRRLAAKLGAEATADGRPQRVEFLRGGFGPEHEQDGPFRWITDSAQIRVVLTGSGATDVRLRLLPAPHPSGTQPTIDVRIGDRLLAQVTVPAQSAIDIAIPYEESDRRPVVQNAGSVVLPNFAGSDRGTLATESGLFYATDEGQYDATEAVPAFCGAACLLRRRALDQVGAFDGSFFTYYEDTDLSLRLRHAGWEILYAPGAIVRHHHSATSIEWSPRFCYFTERNRMLMLMKNGPLHLVLAEWVRYTSRLTRRGEGSVNRKRYLRVQRSLLRQLPSVARSRQRSARAGRSTPLIPSRPERAAWSTESLPA